jgi:hypothetical protein
MLKVLIVGQQSERILEASRFFRDRDIEVLYMPFPNLGDLQVMKSRGVNGVLICDEQVEMWVAFFHRNRWSHIIMH